MYKPRALGVLPLIALVVACHPATAAGPTSSASFVTVTTTAATQIMTTIASRNPPAQSPPVARMTKCRRTTAVASSEHPVAVGAPTAPKVGPLTFHPYPFQAGRPTKMIIHAALAQTVAITLSGFRCSDGRPLRFAYNGQLAVASETPLSSKQFASYGSDREKLPPAPVGTDHTGYVLLSAAGQWLIELRSSTTELGSVLLDVSTQN